MAGVDPGWNIIRDPTRFTPPLFEGEKHLLSYLEKYLNQNWTLYPQPHLNGDRPDIVAVNKNVGVIIFEVKDWILDNYSVENRQWFVRDRNGRYPIFSPIQQLERYRRNIVGLYIPQFGEIIDNNIRNLAGIRLVLYFHNSNGDDARKTCDGVPRNMVVLGRDGLLTDEPDVHWHTTGGVEQPGADLWYSLHGRISELVVAINGVIRNGNAHYGSGYRCMCRNSLLVGASATSYHISGRAVDLNINGINQGDHAGQKELSTEFYRLHIDVNYSEFFFYGRYADTRLNVDGGNDLEAGRFRKLGTQEIIDGYPDPSREDHWPFEYQENGQWRRIYYSRAHIGRE